jgi:hypothetical protein
MGRGASKGRRDVSGEARAAANPPSAHLACHKDPSAITVEQVFR